MIVFPSAALSLYSLQTHESNQEQINNNLGLVLTYTQQIWDGSANNKNSFSMNLISYQFSCCDNTE